ncbi:MAG: hypothetical protein M3Y50_10585, partial [Acidobacteriota bacterium]|nr:hypothetical protein [Acidobacteriota bacterium]
ANSLWSLPWFLGVSHWFLQTIRFVPLPCFPNDHAFNYPVFIYLGGRMYLLFGPSITALVVISVIQLRDHFVASVK